MNYPERLLTPAGDQARLAPGAAAGWHVAGSYSLQSGHRPRFHAHSLSTTGDIMIPDTPEVSHGWAAEWLAAVADGTLTMSQRQRSSVEKHGGGLGAVVGEARARGVHLALLTDDHGKELVVASVHPIQVLC